MRRTRNLVYSSAVTWVRIPPSPPRNRPRADFLADIGWSRTHRVRGATCRGHVANDDAQRASVRAKRGRAHRPKAKREQSHPLSQHSRRTYMTVARISEISSVSKKSFEDAILQGVARANKTLKNVKGAWVKDQEVHDRKRQGDRFQSDSESDLCLERLANSFRGGPALRRRSRGARAESPNTGRHRVVDRSDADQVPPLLSEGMQLGRRAAALLRERVSAGRSQQQLLRVAVGRKLEGVGGANAGGFHFQRKSVSFVHRTSDGHRCVAAAGARSASGGDRGQEEHPVSSDVPDELLDLLWQFFIEALEPLQAGGKLGLVHFQFAPSDYVLAGVARACRGVRAAHGSSYTLSVEFRHQTLVQQFASRAYVASSNASMRWCTPSSMRRRGF